MARRLEKWSHIEVRAVIRFLWAKNVAASEIHRQIVEVYGDKAMSRQQVAKWSRSYQAGREDVENRNMEASGRPSSSRTDIDTARVEEIIEGDRRVTVREIASELDLSYGNVQRIVTDKLRYSKVRARWVPRVLSAEHKATRMMCSLTFLQRYHSDGQHFIDRIVTGDETWLHHFTPISKRATMEWKHAGSQMRKKFKVSPSAGKVMATVFWDTTGVILIENLLPAGKTCSPQGMHAPFTLLKINLIGGHTTLMY
ncbi:Histone-lysine N-methyltransferase SETMAR, partial [Stegodyphus mimosarum]